MKHKKTLKEELQKLEYISLSDSERDAMRSRLISYIDFHTMPEVAPRSPVASIFSYRIFYSRLAVGGALALLILVGTTGVTLAAQNTLPGQPLYAVKVDITEPIQGALITSPVAKATWQNTLAERRLAEASALASQNELATSTQIYLGQEVAEHVENSEQDSAALAARGDSSAALSVQSDLDARLSAHIAFLSLLSPRLAAAGDATTSNEVAVLLQKLSTDESAVSAARSARIVAIADTAASTTPEYAVPMDAVMGATSTVSRHRTAVIAYVNEQNESLHAEEASILSRSIPMLLKIHVGTTTASTTQTATTTITATTTDVLPPESIGVVSSTTASTSVDNNDGDLKGDSSSGLIDSLSNTL